MADDVNMSFGGSDDGLDALLDSYTQKALKLQDILSNLNVQVKSSGMQGGSGVPADNSEGPVTRPNPLSTNRMEYNIAASAGYADSSIQGWVNYNKTRVEDSVLQRAMSAQAQGYEGSIDPADVQGVRNILAEQRIDRQSQATNKRRFNRVTQIGTLQRQGYLPEDGEEFSDEDIMSAQQQRTWERATPKPKTSTAAQINASMSRKRKAEIEYENDVAEGYGGTQEQWSQGGRVEHDDTRRKAQVQSRIAGAPRSDIDGAEHQEYLRKQQEDSLKGIAKSLKQDQAGKDQMARDYDTLDKMDRDAQRRDESENRRQMQTIAGFGRGALYGVGEASQQYLNNVANQMRTGVDNPAGMASPFFGGAGALLGAGVGALFGGFGGIIGGRVGEQVGSAAGNLLLAPYQRDINSAEKFAVSAFAEGTDPMQMARNLHTQAVTANERFAAKDQLSKSDMYKEYAYATLRSFNFIPDAAAAGIEKINHAFGGDINLRSWTGVQRTTGTYSGPDAISQEDIEKVRVNTRMAALARGENLSTDQIDNITKSMTDRYGKYSPNITGAYTSIAEADYNIASNNPFELARTMGLKGEDALMGYLRESGRGSIADQIPGYNRSMQQYDRSLRLDDSNLSTAESGLKTALASGGLGSEQDFASVKVEISTKIKDLRDKLALEVKSAGEGTELGAKLKSEIAQMGERVAATIHQQDLQNYNFAESKVGLSQSANAITQAGISLYGNAGDFTANVGRQQKDIHASIKATQAYANTLPEGIEKNNALARINMMQAQRMGIPAAAQGQDISRYESGATANRSEIATDSTRASLYGQEADIAVAGQERIDQNTSDLNYLRGQLRNAKSKPIADSLRQRIAGLEADNLSTRAGISSAQLSIENQQGGLALGESGFGVASAGNYGTADNVRSAYQGNIAERQRYMQTLTARLNDPNLSRNDRAAVQREILSQREGVMNDTVRGNDALIGRLDTDASIRRGDTAYDTDIALRRGNSAGYRSAVSKDMGEIDRESKDIEAALTDPTLTYSQRSNLTRRRQALRSERFNEREESIDKNYQLQDAEGYDADRMQRQGQRERARLMPFGTSGGLAQDVSMIGFDQQRRNQLAGRYQELERNGELTPQRRNAMIKEDESLHTEQAEIVGKMARGMEDYLPAMSSGSPTGFSHYNTLNLAALRMGQQGAFATNYGYHGTNHLNTTDNWMRQLSGGQSRGITGGEAGKGLSEGAGGLTQAIQHLTSVMERGLNMGGGQGNPMAGMKPGETRQSLFGNLNGLTDARTFGGATTR